MQKTGFLYLFRLHHCSFKILCKRVEAKNCRWDYIELLEPVELCIFYKQKMTCFCFKCHFFLVFAPSACSTYLSVLSVKAADDCQAVCCDNGLTMQGNGLTVSHYTPRLLMSVTRSAKCSTVSEKWRGKMELNWD